MSKVLFVNQLTGAAQAIDTEGKPATVADGMLSSFEATTTMNRLAEGYVQIPWGHYAIRLDIVDDGEAFAITGLIVLDDAGNPKVLKTVTEEDVRSSNAFDERYSVALAKIDTENSLISWTNNPLMADAYTFSFEAAVKVETYTPMEQMLYLFLRQQNSTIEPGEALIVVNFKD